ncbi:hypothetical protein [Paraburkholderia antibiotica]|uniref:Uncharacterized protein n=1 Tax=Paraburkholderia antibiotica TaxID=2728839 RepID=A0A7Y0A165_9BURK|nr:hypothetical protein [Paraburkholderia antibiotica]NML34586.1 hypothetical protein [Paraburkholderia antibiotica]
MVGLLDASGNRRMFVGAVVRGLLCVSGMLALSGHAGADEHAITIVSGTYGENCGAARGNLTGDIARHCNGRQTCDYSMPARQQGSTTAACPGDFLAQWHCDGTDGHSAALSAGARPGDTLVLSCVESRGAGK